MDPVSIGKRLLEVSQPTPSGQGASKLADSFGHALAGAVDSLDQTQRAADDGAMKLAVGDQVELHDVMLAQDRASMSLELAVQVRNKLVEAYQEIMRMQV
ncbi:MAG: flagellar hook-basal body complex protein FliE [Chloroflexota bacterium]|jgi:flagellar hook-basal body complex protein FliE|nr:flagellar hook-basal body complex protein FliE [Chloroflexota bacterium]